MYYTTDQTDWKIHENLFYIYYEYHILYNNFKIRLSNCCYYYLKKQTSELFHIKSITIRL